MPKRCSACSTSCWWRLGFSEISNSQPVAADKSLRLRVGNYNCSNNPNGRLGWPCVPCWEARRMAGESPYSPMLRELRNRAKRLKLPLPQKEPAPCRDLPGNSLRTVICIKSLKDQRWCSKGTARTSGCWLHQCRGHCDLYFLLLSGARSNPAYPD